MFLVNEAKLVVFLKGIDVLNKYLPNNIVFY